MHMQIFVTDKHWTASELVVDFKRPSCCTHTPETGINNDLI